MKIKSLRIQNFRSFYDETIQFNDFTCFVGPNGAGKSTVLCALNIFFQETSHSPVSLTCLEEEDFHCKQTAEPITLTVVFTDLSSEAQEEFSDYSRQGELVVTAIATYDPVTSGAKVKQFGQRKGFVAFKPFFEAYGSGKPVKELKEIYGSLKSGPFTDLPAPGTKDAMAETLRAYEAARPEDCELIPSEDLFYGFSKGVNRLAKYVQWIFVPAVKDASTEQSEGKNTALGKILARTLESKIGFEEKIEALRKKFWQEYLQLLDENQSGLTNLSTTLNKKFNDWSHPNANVRLEWRRDEAKTLKIEEPIAELVAGEGAFEGNIARFGHGFQRSYLIALLQELAGNNDLVGPKLILACEEPELYQHPPQARHLAAVFQELCKRNSQVIVCTHSPYFVSGDGFEDVRIIRRCPTTHRSSSAHVPNVVLAQTIAQAYGKAKMTPSGAVAKIHQALQPLINEMFFTTVLVLVEGLEDVAYITSHLHLAGLWEEYRRLRCHMVPAAGKNHMIEPLALAKMLKIPTFVVFDSDGDESHPENRKKHERDNIALLKLCGFASPDSFPATTFWDTNTVVWQTNLSKTVVADFESEQWRKCCEAAHSEHGHIKGLEKNSLYIASTLSSAYNSGIQSPTLSKLCTGILSFASAV